MNELEGRGAAWTEDRGTSDEERRPLTGAWQASGQQSLLPDRVVLASGVDGMLIAAPGWR